MFTLRIKNQIKVFAEFLQQISRYQIYLLLNGRRMLFTPYQSQIMLLLLSSSKTKQNRTWFSFPKIVVVVVVFVFTLHSLLLTARWWLNEKLVRKISLKRYWLDYFISVFLDFGSRRNAHSHTIIACLHAMTSTVKNAKNDWLKNYLKVNIF